MEWLFWFTVGLIAVSLLAIAVALITMVIQFSKLYELMLRELDDEVVGTLGPIEFHRVGSEDDGTPD